uniref:kelch-like protein 9 n=1 Tax=Styela clava TaxID=7725 RepID=UPI00193A00F3|nr:kelch-like protein 9 [Styela clava]
MAGLLPQRLISSTGSGPIARTQEYQVFKSSTHNAAVLNGLNDLRHDEILCDVTLMAEEQSFPAHKNILASCSPYLRNLFSAEGGIKNEHEVVEIRGVSSEGLKHVINFVYTSELELTMTNVQHVLAAAGHMQLKPILNFCKAFLVTEISVYNCVSIIHIAEHYELRSVEEKAYTFIAEHLNELVKTEELQKLSINNMSFLLDSYSLKNVSELELFEAARQWLLFDSERYKNVRQLMEKIHFPLIPPRDLLRYVNFVDFMRLECNYLLLEASNYHMLPHSQPILQSVRTQVRSTDKRMVIVGGVDQHDRVSNQLLAINDDMSKSEFLPPMHEGLCSHCVAVLNNFLYVLGGQNLFDERGTTAVNTVIRYDPRFNIWMRIAAMNDKRAGFTVSVVENRLYALGGVNSSGRLSSMECYSLEDDRWRYVASVQTGLCDHAQAVYGNLVYISGGFKEGRFSNQLLAYSPRHDTWHERSSMHYARGWHAMVSYGDNILVTGGNSGLTKRVDIHETEIYSGMTDQWTLVSPLPMPHSEGGCEIYDGKIYLVGGYSWAHQKCLSTIQSYDPAKDTWENAGNLPIELSGVRLTLITIPYSVSPRNGLVSGGHVPLSWPPKQVPGRFMEQDPRMMMGGMAGMPLMGAMMSMPGGFPSTGQMYHPGTQPMSGFLDPTTLQDMREAMANIKLSGDPRLSQPQPMKRTEPSRIRSNPSSHKDLASELSSDDRARSQDDSNIYSRPRSTSIDDTISLGSRNILFGKNGLESGPSEAHTAVSMPRSTASSGKSVKSASFRTPVEEKKKTSDESSSSSDDDDEDKANSSLKVIKSKNEDSEVDESTIRAYRG